MYSHFKEHQSRVFGRRYEKTQKLAGELRGGAAKADSANNIPAGKKHTRIHKLLYIQTFVRLLFLQVGG